MTLKSPVQCLFELWTYLISPNCIPWSTCQHFIFHSPLSQSMELTNQIWNLTILISLFQLNPTFNLSASPVDSVSKYITQVYPSLIQTLSSCSFLFLYLHFIPSIGAHMILKMTFTMTYKTQNDLPTFYLAPLSHFISSLIHQQSCLRFASFMKGYFFWEFCVWMLFILLSL